MSFNYIKSKRLILKTLGMEKQSQKKKELVYDIDENLPTVLVIKDGCKEEPQ